MSNTENTWQVNPKVRFRRVIDEAVVIHQDRAEALVLNEVAITFLELCDGERCVQHIMDLMLEQYDVTADVLHRDIREFVTELCDNGLISPVSS